MNIQNMKKLPVILFALHLVLLVVLQIWVATSDKNIAFYDKNIMFKVK